VLTELETPRLLLRPLRAEDLVPYAAMCSDPEVMRYIGDRGARRSALPGGPAGP
jgi:RimJ/RimL family protein N-acetyltransferase